MASVKPLRHRLGRLGPNLVLIIAALYFLSPLLSMARFALQNVLVIDLGWHNLFSKWSLAGMREPFKQPAAATTLLLSAKLAVATVLLTQLLLIPTALFVHVRLPNARGFVEFLTLLPYMVPPIALVAGVIGVIRPNAGWFIRSNYSLVPFYVVLALPFTYRAIDAGIRAIDVRTLIDASRSLGAGWLTTLGRALLPNLKTAIISSSFLTTTVVLGELTMSQVLLKRTFPQFTFEYGRQNGKGGVALSLLTLVISTALLGLLLVLTRSRGGKRAGAGVSALLQEPTTATNKPLSRN